MELVDGERRELAPVARVENAEVVFTEAGDSAAAFVANDDFKLDEAALETKTSTGLIGMAAQANFAWGKSLRGNDYGANAKGRSQRGSQKAGARGS